MWKALRRAGEDVGRGRVQRLMAREGIQGAKRRGRPWRTTTPDERAERRADLLQRDFTAPAPDRLWVGNFTYLRCWEGVVFFAFVLDVFSRRIVSWQFAGHMRTTLVLDALRMALAQRRPGADVALVHHSDRGSQYTSYDYTQTLDDASVLASVGSTGDAYDNALAESFVDTFKTELITDRVWQTRAQLELAIVEYVGWVNTSRLHEALGDAPRPSSSKSTPSPPPPPASRTAGTPPSPYGHRLRPRRPTPQLPSCQPSNPASVNPVRLRGPGWCEVYDGQLARWQRERLTGEQREEVTRLQGVVRDMRAVLTQILKLADELARGTIERQLAKNDLELGLEVVLGSPRRP